MTTVLATYDGSVKDLAEISQVMHEYMQTRSDHAIQVAVEKCNERPGVIRRFFPNAYEKEQQRITIQEMRDLAESEEKMLALYTAVRLEIARKQGDALIASAGMQLQGALAAFALEQIGRLTATVDGSRTDFMQRYLPHKKEIALYQEEAPELVEEAMASLDRERRIYFETLNSLLDGFVAALKSRTSQN
jgi:hypothetical protein